MPYNTTEAKWDTKIDMDWLWEEYNRILKPKRSVLLFGKEPFSTYLRISNLKQYKYDLYWIKNKPFGYQHAKNKPMSRLETISIFSKGAIKHKKEDAINRMFYNPVGAVPSKKKIISSSSSSKRTDLLGKRPNQEGNEYISYTGFPDDILYVSKESESLHPTQKPVELLKILIEMYSEKNDLVLDNTAGSGSTGVAALETNRDFILIEKEKTYYDVINKRINKIKKMRLL